MTAKLEDVVNKSFDYIIVGAGTAGLVVAARLSEDPATSVLVLEAGAANLDDPNLTLPATYGKVFKDPNYDWAFTTVPQKHADNNTYLWDRGKTLGGSSAINFYVWNRPGALDIDAWEKLGNPGWNWKNYLKYSNKSETWIPPTADEEAAERLTYDAQFHGTDGPLGIGFSSTRAGWDIPLQDALGNLGIDPVKEPLGGSPIGSFMAASSTDPRTHKRTYSIEYYYAAAGRKNLTVLTSAPASRILTATSPFPRGDGAPKTVLAKGVEFVYDGKTHTVGAGKEVILSAGAIKSPQLLELSGIGDPKVLNALGIEVKAALPAVGNNSQEHNFVGLSWEINEQEKYSTLDALRDPANVDAQLALYAQGKGLFTVGNVGLAMLPLETVSPRGAELHEAYAKRLRARIASGEFSPGLAAQYERQLEFWEKKDGDLEVISFPSFLSGPNPPEPGKSYLSIIAAVNHQFSRGTIHASSTDANQQPTIDPHYFEEDIDLQTFLEHVKFVRRLVKTDPLAPIVGKEINPGPEVQTDEQLATWLKQTMSTTYHTAGTTAMLPLDKGGVVDPSLKVYHTENIRVVDLGVMPLQIASHTQATVYAIAEQAADIIKGKFVA
ncbi:GMC oxidoreductase 12 [Heterobasidion irregulare TC 32-1]|uniref:GMC oxidoreductase 12 n=1 Tax=Heterobasidion irregulare (strain TC 32-1) TaxID=747525 RepID=W4JQW3_HETIT|nr:GMC oxidoreductase 12 [Heterobasidion irregulare TC 32-1]ETW75271.1 GMC oxidoreductase 12 [Heterobasidion irregulare TC 32-1]